MSEATCASLTIEGPGAVERFVEEIRSAERARCAEVAAAWVDDWLFEHTSLDNRARKRPCEEIRQRILAGPDA